MSYRYIGNKTKLLEEILKHVSMHVNPGDTVVDLMSGTGSVSEAFRVNGYRVISSDMMTFSKYHSMVRLLANEYPSFKKINLGSYENVLNYLNSLDGIKGFFFNEYSPGGSPLDTLNSRMYFSIENAKKIDAINTQIRSWKELKLLSPMEEAFLRHSFILAVNKIANIAGTYGHHRSSWNKSSLSPITLQRAEIVSGYSTDHIVLQGFAEEVSKNIKADLCYIDPPYMKRQYAANYHLIETIARGDTPEAIGVSGLRPWRDQYSNFCSKVKVRDSFRKIFLEMQCSKFLISYSEDGLLKKDQLISFLKEFGKVECQEINYKRFKSNNSMLKSSFMEYIFYLET